MGLWKQLLETAGEKITKDKEQRENAEHTESYAVGLGKETARAPSYFGRSSSH